jgi:hypothetical protein
VVFGDARLKQVGQARTSNLTVIGNARCVNEKLPGRRQSQPCEAERRGHVT